jgi:hypothetical protein
MLHAGHGPKEAAPQGRPCCCAWQAGWWLLSRPAAGLALTSRQRLDQLVDVLQLEQRRAQALLQRLDVDARRGQVALGEGERGCGRSGGCEERRQRGERVAAAACCTAARGAATGLGAADCRLTAIRSVTRSTGRPLALWNTMATSCSVPCSSSPCAAGGCCSCSAPGGRAGRAAPGLAWGAAAAHLAVLHHGGYVVVELRVARLADEDVVQLLALEHLRVVDVARPDGRVDGPLQELAEDLHYLRSQRAHRAASRASWAGERAAARRAAAESVGVVSGATGGPAGPGSARAPCARQARARSRRGSAGQLHRIAARHPQCRAWPRGARRCLCRCLPALLLVRMRQGAVGCLDVVVVGRRRRSPIAGPSRSPPPARHRPRPLRERLQRCPAPPINQAPKIITQRG